MEDRRNDARGTRGRSRVPPYALAAVFGLVAILTVVSGSWASGGSTHFVLGPAGYSHGQDTLIVAGTQTPTLGSGDQVVICHALGMTNKDGYVQNAPAAGVTFGHAGAGHQAGEDIIPPFIYSKGDVLDQSLVNGQNWTTAGRLVYENGCQPLPPATGSLTVVKHVVGGSAVPADFQMHVDAVGTADDSSFAGSLHGVTKTLPVGAYSVTESGGPPHYTASYSHCTGMIVAHAPVTCTITNTYDVLPPATGSLMVVKHVVGGSAVPADFQMHVDAVGTADDSSFAGSLHGVTKTLPVGAYSVTESGGPPHYTASYSHCTGMIVAHAPVTCTITNTYTPPETPGTTTTTTTTTITTPVTTVTTQTPVTAATTVTPAPIRAAVDLVVTKRGTPDPVAVGSVLTYTITVTNRPPSDGLAFAATDVTLVDPLPTGVAHIAATPSQGTCTVQTDGLVCRLGSLEPGAAAAVVVTVRPASVGRLTNSVAAVAAEPELNPADNWASETTTVRGPFAPPALRCTAISVRPISLQVGHKRVVIVRVSDQRGKPLSHAIVTVRGPGVNVRGTTSNTGIYRHVFHPKKPGVLVVRALPGASEKCLGRIGVVGVFQPPVTG